MFSVLYFLIQISKTLYFIDLANTPITSLWVASVAPVHTYRLKQLLLSQMPFVNMDTYSLNFFIFSSSYEFPICRIWNNRSK